MEFSAFIIFGTENGGAFLGRREPRVSANGSKYAELHRFKTAFERDPYVLGWG